VNRISPKQPRQRLDLELYEQLREQVIRCRWLEMPVLREQLES